MILVAINILTIEFPPKTLGEKTFPAGAWNLTTELLLSGHGVCISKKYIWDTCS